MYSHTVKVLGFISGGATIGANHCDRNAIVYARSFGSPLEISKRKTLKGVPFSLSAFLALAAAKSSSNDDIFRTS